MIFEVLIVSLSKATWIQELPEEKELLLAAKGNGTTTITSQYA